MNIIIEIIYEITWEFIYDYKHDNWKGGNVYVFSG